MGITGKNGGGMTVVTQSGVVRCLNDYKKYLDTMEKDAHILSDNCKRLSTLIDNLLTNINNEGIEG